MLRAGIKGNGSNLGSKRCSFEEIIEAEIGRIKSNLLGMEEHSGREQSMYRWEGNGPLSQGDNTY